VSNVLEDGRTYSYVPPKAPPEWLVPHLHTEVDEVDATTFEVLRHAIWNVNVEHGGAIARTSGSPIVVHHHDFNPVVLDEWGDFVYIGPWLQYLVSASPPAVKWTLENRHPRPGIVPGSMFFTNDPWIGSTHQADASLLAPVFVDGKIFCWVANSLHHADLGGTAPGGFNPVAQDIFWESGVFPPIRLVEDGEIRTDLEEEFLRRSRMPEIVGVDLHAQVAGCRVAVERMEALIARYGAGVIKGVMRKIQDDSETAFVSRMQTIPDGEWREEAFLEMAVAGDRQIFRNAVTIKKTGDQLEFTNETTDPQVGTLNCTLPAWAGAISAMVNSQLMHDQMFAVEGALRRIQFNAEPGTITNARFPSPVSLAVLTLDQCIALAALAISKMVSCSRDAVLQSETQSTMGSPTFPVAAWSGQKRTGEVFAGMFPEPAGAGMAAWSWRDGIDAGGWPWDPLVRIPNVEETEESYPLLYLWRRITPDSGGAGRFRGGSGMEIGAIAHGVDSMDHHEASAGHNALPMSSLFGGGVSDVHRPRILRESDVLEGFKAGRVATADSLKFGTEEELAAKAFGVRQGPEDVFVLSYAGAGGYGDPLERDPELVATDAGLERISVGEAERLYGVVLVDGDVDEAATKERREAIRATRRAWNGPSDAEKVELAEGGWSIGPGLAVVARDGGAVLACDSCGTVLSPSGANWKDGALVGERKVEEGNANLLPPERLIDDDVVLREFACPGCARLLDSEVRRRNEPPLWDIRITEEI
jgi:N-methylhydantoinase B